MGGEILVVLWAYRTTQRVPTRETPFSLAYGTEAIIPVDISMPTLRVERVVLDQNDTQLHRSPNPHRSLSTANSGGSPQEGEAQEIPSRRSGPEARDSEHSAE